MSTPLLEQVRTALGTVIDPEIKRPITDLGMVESVEVDGPGMVRLTVLLTVAGCPMKDTITRDVNAAVRAVDGVTDVDLTLGVMSAEQRAGLKRRLTELAETIGEPNVKVLYDVYHLHDTPDVLEHTARLGDRLSSSVHICDWREDTRNDFDRALPGEGIIESRRRQLKLC